MKYYAVQIRSSAEQKFIEQAKKQLLDCSDFKRIIYLQREMTIFRKGIKAKEIQPVFPGYVFIELNNSINQEIFSIVRHTPNFYRFLRSNQDVRELSGNDLEIVKHFLDFGETAKESIVFFNDQDRIVVTKGPLKGLEGNIIKVDKRKKRAKIQIDFNNSQIGRASCRERV